MSLNSPHRLERTSGFTLIELLVVLAVLAVLMAVLLPSLHAARSLAKRATCASNLKALGIAWVLYLNDNEQCFPRLSSLHVRYGGWPGAMPASWKQRPLNPYAVSGKLQELTKQEAKVFRCPADRGGAGRAGYTCFDYYGISYPTNTCLVGPDKFPARDPNTAELVEAIDSRIEDKHTTLDRVTNNHQQVVLAGDMGWYYQWWEYNPSSPEKKEQLEWHNKPDTHNLLMLDGHVSFLKIEPGAWLVEGSYYVNPFKDLNDLARP